MAKQCLSIVHKVILSFLPMTGKHMKKYIILISLAAITMTCAVLEVLVPSLPTQFIQLNGLLIIVCTAALIVWVLKAQAGSLDKD
jgi:hypothetical protein